MVNRGMPSLEFKRSPLKSILSKRESFNTACCRHRRLFINAFCDVVCRPQRCLNMMIPIEFIRFRQITSSLLVGALLVGLLHQPNSASAESTNITRTTKRPAATKNLNVGFIRQERLLGVPTSAAIIMSFYGDLQTPRKLKNLSRGKEHNASEPFDDFSITFYRDIVKAAAVLGYNWHERSFSDDSIGFERGLASIKQEIEHGRPLMINVSAPDGHTIVVTGFDETTQSIFVVDPDVPAPGRYAITYARLQSIWNEHAFGRNFRSLVITPPIPYVS